MANTRSSKTSTGTKDDLETGASTSNAFPSSAFNPPKVFILPKQASTSARVVSLAHPRHRKARRYLICPERGVYEFTLISPRKSNPRSWILEPQVPNGYLSLSQSPDLHVATRIDPMFLLLPVLYSTGTQKDSRRLFHSLDDHLDNLADRSPQISWVLVSEKVRAQFEEAMRSVCDCVEAGGEDLFRLSESKLLARLLEKARNLSETTLPGSMEEKFVKPALSAPTTWTPTSHPNASGETVNGTQPQIKAHVTDSPGKVEGLQRQRIAFNFICAGYLPPELASHLNTLLCGPETPLDFSRLERYLQKMRQLRQEAAAARAPIDYTRKRRLDDDEAAHRAEKKRNKENEDKRRKTSESRSVRELKKVNVSGMKKLSEFFK